MDRQAMNDDFSKQRREVLIGTGALGLATLMGSAVAHAGEHEMMGGGMVHMHGGNPNQAMIDAFADCIKTSEQCIAHCLSMFKTGDTSTVDCAISVEQSLAFCRAHMTLASLDSPHLAAMCELAIKVCGDCEQECRKHEKKHSACKACADACAACVKECKVHLKA